MTNDSIQNKSGGRDEDSSMTIHYLRATNTTEQTRAKEGQQHTPINHIDSLKPPFFLSREPRPSTHHILQTLQQNKKKFSESSTARPTTNKQKLKAKHKQKFMAVAPREAT